MKKGLKILSYLLLLIFFFSVFFSRPIHAVNDCDPGYNLCLCCKPGTGVCWPGSTKIPYCCNLSIPLIGDICTGGMDVKNPGPGNGAPVWFGCPNENNINTALGCIPVDSLSNFVKWFLSKIIFVATGVAFLLMAFGAIKIITSSGDPKNVQAGQELITSAISGLLFIILSLFLLRLIGVNILRIPGFGN